MSSYFYIVKSKGGLTQKGVMKAASGEEVERHFRDHGYLVLSVEEEKKSLSRKHELWGFSFQAVFKAVLCIIIVGGVVGYINFKKYLPLRREPVGELLKKTTHDKGPVLSGEETDYGSMPAAVSIDGADEVDIKMRGSQDEVSIQDPPESSDNYRLARHYYQQGMITGNKASLKEAVKYAQYVLSSRASPGTKEEMKQMISDARQRIWGKKTW